MKRICQPQHPRPEETAGICPLCWLFTHNEEYRQLWSTSADLSSLAKRRNGDCQNRGPETRRLACTQCRQHVQIKVFQCRLHRECTLGKKLEGLACCVSCDNYQGK